jgi:hypothetical protein
MLFLRYNHQYITTAKGGGFSSFIKIGVAGQAKPVSQKLKFWESLILPGFFY